MTCLEKYLKDYHPGYTEDDLNGIIDSVCPSDYGYLPNPIDCETASMSCEDCWNREIPDNKTNISSEQYRLYLTECIKMAAKMIDKNAEDIAGHTDCISNLNISIDFDQEKMCSIPEITITRSHVPNAKEIDNLIDYRHKLFKEVKDE